MLGSEQTFFVQHMGCRKGMATSNTSTVYFITVRGKKQHIIGVWENTKLRLGLYATEHPVTHTITIIICEMYVVTSYQENYVHN